MTRGSAAGFHARVTGRPAHRRAESAHAAPPWSSRSSSAQHRSRSFTCFGRRDCGDEADLFATGERRVHAAVLADVHAVHVDVHELPELPALVEDEVGDRQGAEAERRCPPRPRSGAARRPRRRASRKEHYCQSAASTERMGGECVAASLQLEPPSVVAKTDPLCVEVDAAVVERRRLAETATQAGSGRPPEASSQLPRAAVR